MAFIFIDYLYWHLTIAPLNILKIMSSYIKSIHHRFLIAGHLRTLFYPWHRQDPSQLAHKESLDFGSKIVEKIIDFYIRILAAFMRLSVVITGLFFEGIVFVGFILGLIVWVIWPVLSILIFLIGINSIF